jgi:diguanylate cyclase (GGDEF)-like protein
VRPVVIRNRRWWPIALVACALAAAVAGQQGEAALDEIRALMASDREAALERLDERLDRPSPETPDALRQRAEALRMRGQLLRAASRYDAARADADAIRAIAERLEDPALLASALHLAGTVEAERGRLADALQLFQRADERLRDIGAPARRARMQIALGTVHLFADAPERAIEYFDRADELAREAGNDSMRITALANKAVALERTRGPAASLAAHRDALALAESAENAQQQGLHNANICARLVSLERYREARSHCERAVEQLQDGGADRHLAGAYMTQGRLRLETGRPGAALDSFRRALALAQDRIPSVERELLRYMADAHLESGEPDQAIARLNELLALRDELDQRQREERLQELDARYRVRQAEQEVELLSLQTRLQDAEIQRRNLLLIGSGVLLLVLSAVALLTWRDYRAQRKLKSELAERNEALQSAMRRLGRLAREDALTRLLTRNVFLPAARKEIARTARSGKPAALAMADIDSFKRINDEHGHSVGDQVIAGVAGRLRASLRDMDYVCRWGGEEFVVLLPGVTVDQAHDTMERVRSAFENDPIDTDAGPFTVTLTFGVAPLGDDIDDTIKAADAAMYAGKRAGRNRVVESDRAGPDAERTEPAPD